MGRRGYRTIKLSRPSLKERFRDWLMDEDRDSIESIALESSDLNSEPFRLNVYRANGGTIVETKTWNHKRDENDYRLHIITDDKDLGEEIGKIITMESLRG
jgi:hypothetical protein